MKRKDIREQDRRLAEPYQEDATAHFRDREAERKERIEERRRRRVRQDKEEIT